MKDNSGRSSSESLARERVGFVFLGSLAFCLLYYATGVFMLASRLDFFRAVTWGGTATFFLVSTIAYAACLAVAALFFSGERSESDSADGDLGARTSHRTGVVTVEVATLILGLVGLAVSLLFNPRLAGLVIAASAPAVASLSRPVYKRQVGKARTIFVPPGVPDTSLVPLPDSTEPLPPGYELIHYSWRYRQGLGEGKSFSADIPINLGLYEDFCRSNATQTARMAKNPHYAYAVLGITSEIRRLAEIVRAIASQESYGTLDEIGVAYSFVQDKDNIPYAFDIDTKGQQDYWRYPLETLYERTGDCECKSILLASLLLTMGYRVVSFEIPPDGPDMPGHVAIGVEVPKGVVGRFAPYQGRQYFFLETTASGWSIGEVPEDFNPKGIEVYPLTLEG